METDKIEPETDKTEPVKIEKKEWTVQQLIDSRPDGAITIEATVDTGFEFMAVDECRKKFGCDVPLVKERGRIFFNIDKSQYFLVPQMRSVDNLYLIISYTPSLGLQGTELAADLEIAKNQAHVPNWDLWLPVWCDLVGFKGITKPSQEQYEVAYTRATKDKEKQKELQAERQKRYKERQEAFFAKKAQRESRAAQNRAAREAGKTAAVKSVQDSGPSPLLAAFLNDEPALLESCNDEPDVGEKLEGSPENDAIEPLSETTANLSLQKADGESDAAGQENASTTDADAPADGDVPVDGDAPADADCGDAAEVESLPDYEREADTEVAADIPPEERVLRFRGTCFRTGKHAFGSMEAAREFGGELQTKFNWVVDLTNYHCDVVLTIVKDSAQVGIALTRRSLHRRNITFFGPTTLRATVCHNLLRMADVKPGDIIVDPMAGGGSIPIEGAMSFPGVFLVGGDIHPKAVGRAYSNVRSLQNTLGHGLRLDHLRWDTCRLPLKEACADVVVSDLPFGVRMGTKSSNGSLYRRVLLEMARITRPGTGRAILLTQDRRSFAGAVVGTFGLWWQTHVLGANIGGLDAAVFTLKRTSKLRLDEAELAEGARSERGSWRGGPSSRGHGGRRGRSYPRGGQRGNSRNWRDRQ